SRFELLLLEIDQGRPGHHERDLLSLIRGVFNLELFNAERHQGLVSSREQRRNQSPDYFHLSQLVCDLQRRRGDGEGNVLFGNRRMVVVLEGRDVVGQFGISRLLLGQHRAFVADAHERRGGELDRLLVQHDEPARIVQAVVQTVGRNADRACGRPLQGHRLRELQGLGHALEVDRHFVLFVNGGDLGSRDGINIAHVERRGFWYFTFAHRSFVFRLQGRTPYALASMLFRAPARNLRFVAGARNDGSYSLWGKAHYSSTFLPTRCLVSPPAFSRAFSGELRVPGRGGSFQHSGRSASSSTDKALQPRTEDPRRPCSNRGS